jgi:hypothetical protein
MFDMECNNIIETIGSISKMEKLQSVEQDFAFNSLVLKNIDPFPGYHSKSDKLNFIKKQESIFIMLRHPYPSEQINTIFKKLASERIIKCYPSYGEIITAGSVNACIRLKGIENYALIPYIQKYFQDNDLQLMNYEKMYGYANIKIFKSFRIVRIAEGLYRDATEIEKLYIRIPASLNWKQFDKITNKIKCSIENPNFDGALGAIYRFNGTEDVIRIYDRETTLEKAKLLKMMYLKEIKGECFIPSRPFHFH